MTSSSIQCPACGRWCSEFDPVCPACRVTLPQESLSLPRLPPPPGDGRDKPHLPNSAEDIRGRVLVERYRLHTRLGGGGHGEVWSADDLLVGRRVAVKLLGEGVYLDQTPARREILVLRHLRLQGVVQLIDEGADQGQVFLVMEQVEGAPFPGAPLPCDWASIAGATEALLEIVGRIHATGVVHQDLKPGNVLVSASGRVTVLDFGLSVAPASSGLSTRTDAIEGTLPYLSPEQAFKEPVTARTDIHAIGIMVYEALAGRPPYSAASVFELARTRRPRRALPLKDVAPAVPEAVAEVVDRLIAHAPADRPASASDVLAALRGQRLIPRTGWVLPRLGGDAPVRALADAVRAGRSVDLHGPAGAGLTRCLHEAAEMLEREGRRVLWVTPDQRPFACLEPLIGAPAVRSSQTLDEAVSSVDAGLKALLATGAVVLVDEVTRVDDWSSSALERCRPFGAVVRAFAHAGPAHTPAAPDVVSLTPLDEAALKSLFSGPDRIFHLPTDAAHALWERTGGLAKHVAEEVNAWLHTGIARSDGARLAVDRDALGLLEVGLGRTADSGGVPPCHPPRSATGALPQHIDETLAWVTLAWPHVDVDRLVVASGLPRWQLEAHITELRARGAVRALDDGRIQPRAAVSFNRVWTWEQRRAAHRAMAHALERGSVGRLFHLLMAADSSRVSDRVEIAREGRMLAERFAREGRLNLATTVLGDALLGVRRHLASAGESDLAVELELLRCWVEVALSERTPGAMDRVLYELCRVRPAEREVLHLQDLVRASLARGAGGERAFKMAELVEPFDELRLERHRQAVRIVAARRCSMKQEEAVLADVACWAAKSGDPEIKASLAGWYGRLRYRQERFDEAAAFQAMAISSKTWMTDRINARLNGAAALMEAFRLDEAAAWAEEARSLADQCRHAYFEARAAWTLRAIEYRAGKALDPDVDLCDVLAGIGIREVEAISCLTEAAVAWRAGRHALAAKLASRAHRLWESTGWRVGALLARCLALVCGDTPLVGEIEALASEAQACSMPRVALQALGLLACVGRASPTWKAAAEMFAEGVPLERRRVRMDVLATNEALAAFNPSLTGGA
ncbi:protein kinase domain-containing protein [Sorangium sp. So ce426]|uniref:protein kinase domain-containing protein n=1 Tax=Sorangium sp. So ce426 TaxID=3133312 RepID=UPI003F5B4B93